MGQQSHCAHAIVTQPSAGTLLILYSSPCTTTSQALPHLYRDGAKRCVRPQQSLMQYWPLYTWTLRVAVLSHVICPHPELTSIISLAPDFFCSDLLDLLLTLLLSHNIHINVQITTAFFWKYPWDLATECANADQFTLCGNQRLLNLVWLGIDATA